jgi:hypothetical protein
LDAALARGRCQRSERGHTLLARLSFALNRRR